MTMLIAGSMHEAGAPTLPLAQRHIHTSLDLLDWRTD